MVWWLAEGLFSEGFFWRTLLWKPFNKTDVFGIDFIWINLSQNFQKPEINHLCFRDHDLGLCDLELSISLDLDLALTLPNLIMYPMPSAGCHIYFNSETFVQGKDKDSWLFLGLLEKASIVSLANLSWSSMFKYHNGMGQKVSLE